MTRAEDVFSSSVPKGSVASQSPADGTLARGQTVTIAVSKGPEMIAVPDVTGMTEAQATKRLEDAGFAVEAQRFLGGTLDEVTATRPRGGTAPKGSTVTILVI